MSLVLHQFKKDCLSLRWLLFVWGVLILLQSFLVGTAGLGASDWIGHLAYKMAAAVIPLLQSLLVVIMVPLLVHEEPLVGTSAAWLTRPLSRRTLLGSKALFALAVFVIPPLAAELGLLAASGVSPSDMALAGAEILLTQAALVVGAAALASVTPSFARFVVWAVALIAASMLLGLALGIGQLYGNPDKLWRLADPELLRAQKVVGLFLTLLLGTTVVVHQYLTRRTRRSVLVGGGGLVLLTAVQVAWSGGLPPPPPLSPRGFDASQVEASVKPETVDATDALSLRASTTPRKMVSAAAECKGIPPASFCRLEELRAALKYPDGKIVAVQGLGGRPSFRSFDPHALETALGGSAISSSSFLAAGGVWDMFEVDGSAYDERGKIPALLQGEGTLSVQQYRVAAELPLQRGASYRSGSEQVVISDVLRGPGSCRVLLRERKIHLLFSRPAQALIPLPSFGFGGRVFYVLWNRERRQAFLNDRPNIDWPAFGSSQRLSHDAVALVYTSQSLFQKNPPLDDAWLSGAVLARVETFDLGRVDKPITVADFVLDRGQLDLSRGGSTVAATIEPSLTAVECYERGNARLEEALGRPWPGPALEEAKAYFDRALALDPRSVPAYAARALVSATTDDGAQARRAAVKTWLDKARAIGATDPAFERVEAYLVDREGGDSARVMEAVVQKSPAVATYWRDLGYFYGHQYRLNKAVVAFDRALQLAPNPPEAAWTLARRGDAYEYAGRHREAREAYEKVVSLRSDHAPFWTRLCQIDLEAGDCRKAQLAATHALDLEDSSLSRSCLLRAQLCLGTFRGTSLAAQTSWAPDLVAIGDFFRDRGDHAKARAYYERTSLREAGPVLAASLSELALREGDPSRAWSVLEPALIAHPEDADVLAQAAAVQQKKGDRKRALELAAQSLEARLDERIRKRLDAVFGADTAYRSLSAKVSRRVEALFTYYEGRYDYQHLRRDDQTAQWVIGKLGATEKDRQAVPYLLPYLSESAFAETRARAADALWYIGDHRAVPHLIAALDDPSLKVKGFAASGLGDLGDPAAVPQLLGLFERLEDNRDETKARVADALGKLGDRRAVAPIRASLERIHDAGYVQWAQGALARLERER